MAVHPVFSGRAVELLAASPLTRLTVTDSIPISPEESAGGLWEEAHRAPDGLAADAIERIHDGRSVSQLFR